MSVAFVHQCQVVEHVLLLTVHATDTVLQDYRNFVSEGWIVRDTVWYCARQNVRVTIFVL
ncbi:Uncharacterised protein [Vibrio cholerae]|nr:Uncharacterised protein [Vibrio cholerae]CSD57257.1 Uncharacterised protein [Vibrio cholerae]